VKKSLLNKQLRETFNEYFIAIAENDKRQSKNILLMMITIIWIVTPISWNKLLLNLTKVWNVNAQQQKLNEL
jgi:hypothetical protein